MNNNNDNDLNPIKRAKEIALGIYILFLFLMLTFPPMNKNDVFDGWKIIINWGSGGHSINKISLLIEIIILTLLYRGLLWVYEDYRKYEENLKELNKDQKTNLQYSQSSFDDFIAGRMSLAKCFWLYHVLIGFVLGFLCAYFAEMHEQRWLYIFPLAYYAVVTVAVWNCATLYAKDKLENKQPYGWAIAAKILIVLDAVGLIGQIILMLNKN